MDDLLFGWKTSSLRCKRVAKGYVVVVDVSIWQIVEDFYPSNGWMESNMERSKQHGIFLRMISTSHKFFFQKPMTVRKL
jgi:hypothetical protein